MEKQFDLIPLLSYIDPASLNYIEWCQVGMALKVEGYECSVWDEWSRSDNRYHRGECERKWSTFSGSGVTGATITQMAKEGGWKPSGNNHEIGWDDEIDFSRYDSSEVLHKESLPPEPDEWDGKKDLIKYIETLFQSGDNISVTVQSRFEDEKWKPNIAYDFDYDNLLEKLRKYDCIEKATGDYNPEAGAWICFNPVDGARKNDNVTDYRYSLVESDTQDIETQYRVIKNLHLPCAAIVHSGGKSIHAIVHIDAKDKDEYKERVNFLYETMSEYGMDVDTQNKNSARLSRMPGVYRNGKKQYLIATNVGFRNWDQWKEYIDGINDGLPSICGALDGEIEEMPPAIIGDNVNGILREEEIMYVTGQSKVGKSNGLLSLCVAFATGTEWFGFKCRKGKVLYVNMELPKRDRMNRVKRIYEKTGYEYENGMFDCWDMRGFATDSTKFVDQLKKRVGTTKYQAIIIDPIYFLLSGDENDAATVTPFFNNLIAVSEQLHTAIIICHHHSKGAQSGKDSMDRGAGSGVFARASSTIVDLMRLYIPDSIKEQYNLDPNAEAIEASMTTRSFARPNPVRALFDYPIHIVDTEGMLDGCEYSDVHQMQNLDKSSRKKGDHSKQVEAFNKAFTMLEEEHGVGRVSLNDMKSALKLSSRDTVKNHMEWSGYEVDEKTNTIRKK